MLTKLVFFFFLDFLKVCRKFHQNISITSSQLFIFISCLAQDFPYDKLNLLDKLRLVQNLLDKLKFMCTIRYPTINLNNNVKHLTSSRSMGLQKESPQKYFECINVVMLSKNVIRNQQKLCWMKKITTKIHPQPFKEYY